MKMIIDFPLTTALGGGDRELIVLRSDDGEGWREHSTAIYDEDEGWNAMGAAEGELYQDIVATTGLTPEGKPAAQATLALDRTAWGSIYGSARFFQRLGMHLVNDFVDLQLRMVGT